MPNPSEWDQIDQYFAGELNEVDAAAVRRYLMQHPDAGRALGHVARALEGDPDIVRDGDAAASWQGMRERMHARDQGMDQGLEPNQEQSQEPRRRLPRGRARQPVTGVWKTFSLASLVVAVSAIALFFGGHFLLQRVHAQAKVYATHTGERRTITLADGTRVMLAPESQLTVGPSFGSDQRAVALTGEAYFTVAHTVGRPFIVQTAGVTTRVLGTTFDVSHYPTDPDTRISVVDGKVAVGSSASLGEASHVLARGMIAYVNDSATRVMVDANVQNYVAWTRGRFVAAETPLKDVVATLSRWYGLQFRFADPSLANRHITAVFDYNAQGDVLKTLQLMLGVHMTFHGNVVTLIPGRTVHETPQARRILTDSNIISTEVGR